MLQPQYISHSCATIGSLTKSGGATDNIKFCKENKGMEKQRESKKLTLKRLISNEEGIRLLMSKSEFLLSQKQQFQYCWFVELISEDEKKEYVFILFSRFIPRLL